MLDAKRHTTNRLEFTIYFPGFIKSSLFPLSHCEVTCIQLEKESMSFPMKQENKFPYNDSIRQKQCNYIQVKTVETKKNEYTCKCADTVNRTQTDYSITAIMRLLFVFFTQIADHKTIMVKVAAINSIPFNIFNKSTNRSYTSSDT